jgi:hypothetical protein
MEIVIGILEDVAVIVLTLVILVVALYLVLLALQWGLRLKLGSREEEGLAELWHANLPKPPSIKADKDNTLNGDKRDLI